MAERTRPALALSFTDGRNPRRYVSKRSAYYQIAKRTVLAKYPPWLDWDSEPDLLERGPQWTPELARARCEKSAALFNNGPHFDPRRWRVFISRVASFMMYVDARRGADEQLRTRSAAELNRMWTTRERWLSELADEMTAIKRVIDEKERAAGHA